MKWQIVAEHQDDMVKVAYRGGRGGHRGSSAPSSPSSFNYINQGQRDMAAKDPGSARRRKLSNPGSPAPSSALHSQFTPDRSTQFLGPSQSTIMDGSPLPRARKPLATTIPSSENPPRSPTLTSSYNPEDNFVTPAPQRLHPRLAPPSTAQRPSQHMPTSSPAPFWKYADIGSTPLKPAQFDMSPSKPSLGLRVHSSSPPPAAEDRSPVGRGSPTRRGARMAPEIKEDVPVVPAPVVVPAPTASSSMAVVAAADDEEVGFDLTK